MKKINLLFVFVLVALTFSTITAQFTSVKDGEWSVASTWSTDPNATSLPDSNSSVVINHTLSTVGGDVCRNLTINGKVWGGEYLHIYGNLINKGEIRDDPNHGSDYLTVTINGSIINDGLYITGTTNFEGNLDHHLRSYNGNTISFGSAFGRNAEVAFIVDSVASISGNLLLGGSKMILPGGYVTPDTLILNNGLIDGGIFECNNNVILGMGVSSTIGFSGVFSEQQHTFVKDAILEGYLNINGSSIDSTIGTTTFIGNVVNNGTIVTAPHNSGNKAHIFIEGDFFNNGTVQKQSNGIDLYFIKNSEFINKGQLSINSIVFKNNHGFRNETDSIDVLEINGLDSLSRLNIWGDIIFKSDATIDMKGGAMSISENSKIFHFGMTNTFFDANNSIISTRSNSDVSNSIIMKPKIYNLSLSYNSALLGGIRSKIEILENGKLTITHRNARIYGIVLNNGEVSGNIDSSIVGNVENNGIWESNCFVEGDVINNGTIDNYNMKIGMNIINNGSWKSINSLELVGTEDQFISMPTDSSIHTNQVKFNSMLEGTNYQWQRNGEDIPDAVYSNYTIWSTGLLPDNATYYCVVDGNNSRNIIIQSLTDVSDDEEIEIETPTEYSLSQNYPNPFNPSTTIKYQIPSNGKSETVNTKLIVFDILGKEVAELVNKNQKSGNYEVQFNASHLTSGIYFYKLQSGNYVATKKLLLLK